MCGHQECAEIRLCNVSSKLLKSLTSYFIDQGNTKRRLVSVDGEGSKNRHQQHKLTGDESIAAVQNNVEKKL